ncbi:MAG: tol-pal system protein YbgF [Gemmatimonadota bacterium]
MSGFPRASLCGRGATALLLLVGQGCATKGDLHDLEGSMISEIRSLEAAQDALLERIGVAFDSMGVQERRQLTGRGEMQRQFDELRDLLAQLLELAGQNNRLLTELRSDLRSRERSRPTVRPGAAGPTGRPPEGAPERPADEASVFYNAALGQYRRGAYETARNGFRDFLENYPGHELAPDAQYFLAETYASEEDREPALEELSKVWEGWPDSPRAATALYRSGVLEVERGRLSDARVFFQRVLAGYPNSDEAPLAESQLRRLRP